jgi:hypothetical protein
MDFKFTIAVAADGALGSVARYLVGVGGKAVRIGIYVGTLIINVTGFISDWCIRRTVRHHGTCRRQCACSGQSPFVAASRPFPCSLLTATI